MTNKYNVFVVATAKGEVGYTEKNLLSQIWDKISGAGSKNYNKYAWYFDNEYAGFYNGKKQGAEWCDIFVDWCFVRSFGVEQARAMLNQPEHSLGAGCTYSMRYYQKAGRFFTSQPKVGDQIFFGDKSNASKSTHTGLVVKVDAKKVYTIEGNKSNKVQECSYSLTDKKIVGYGRPDFDVLPKPSLVPTVKKGDKGNNVKYVQAALIALGYNCGTNGADADFGNKTDTAVREFQKKNGLLVDGIVGIKTHTAIYELLR